MPRPLNHESGPGVLLTARVPGPLKDRVRALALRLQKPYGRVVQEAIEAGLPHVDGTETRSVSKPAKGEDSEIRSEEGAFRGHVLEKWAGPALDPVQCSVCKETGSGKNLRGRLCPGGGS